MKFTRYIMSFTNGGLFRLESIAVAALFLECNDWQVVRERVLSQNLLQARTAATSQRHCREILGRLKMLHPSELRFLGRTNAQEQGYLLWLAICRRYKFIADFAVEVIRERLNSLNMNLNHADYDAFYDNVAQWHPELEKISPATRSKLRQVLFRMMREADLLSEVNTIKTAMLARPFLAAVPKDRRQDILFLPILETDVDWNKTNETGYR
jgi:hypothetical protein